MRRKARRSQERGWLILLVIVGALLLALLSSQQLRFRVGGKWSVPFVGAAFLAVVYLQPAVQQRVKKWNQERRDEAERRWWRERDRREREALLRTETLRQQQAQTKKRRP